MITKNCLVVPIAAIAITFSSEIALAVENTTAASSTLMWSLIALVATVSIIGKLLITDALPKPEKPSSEALAEQVVVPVAAEVDAQVKEIAENAEIKDATEVEIKNVNLKDGDKRCQAVTAKGTRCKRKINLEDASIEIDGTNYDLTICRQHKTNGFKPFPKLFK